MARLVDTVRGSPVLDVEFLLNPPINLSRPLVYRYRSGLLRGRFKKALREIAERNGELVPCTPTELPYLSVGDGLFPSFVQCDWPPGRTKPSELDDVLAALADQDRPLAVLIPESHGLFKRASWPSASRGCLVVEEPIVSSATLDAILSYLVRHDAPVFAEGLLGQNSFRDYFERLVAEPMAVAQIFPASSKSSTEWSCCMSTRPPACFRTKVPWPIRARPATSCCGRYENLSGRMIRPRCQTCSMASPLGFRAVEAVASWLMNLEGSHKIYSRWRAVRLVGAPAARRARRKIVQGTAIRWPPVWCYGRLFF